jgi:hypothetical protein
LARASSGIASATARAAGAVGFQAIATRSSFIGRAGERKARLGAPPVEVALRRRLALARILFEPLDQPCRQGAAADIARHRDGDAGGVGPDMQHIEMRGERPGDGQRRGEGLGIAVAAGDGNQDRLDHRPLSRTGRRDYGWTRPGEKTRDRGRAPTELPLPTVV